MNKIDYRLKNGNYVYFAYGSNLNKAQMKLRCPKAKPICYATLPDYRLVFRGVADVVSEDGAEVQGWLWEITDDCLKALDRYEGYPRLYGRKPVLVYLPDEDRYTVAMTYYMKQYSLSQPSASYVGSILKGYRDFNMKPGSDILRPNIGIKRETAKRLYQSVGF